MITALTFVLVLVVLVVGAARVFGGASYEVESGDAAKYAELGGVWVRYRVSGSGPPVLLVHGLLSSGRVWDRLAEDLSGSFTVYSLDLVGFGESDKPLSGYGIRQGSRLLHAFCLRFGLPRAAVIGHDVGGDMAVKLAVDHPDVVNRIALVATPATEDQMDLPTPVWLAVLPFVGPLFFALLRASRFWRRLGIRSFVLKREDVPEEMVEDAARSTPAALARTISALRRELSRERLLRQARGARVPMLLVTGDEDRIVDPGSVEDWAEEAPQAQTCFIAECGHLPMIEHAEEFNERILAFLTGDEGGFESARDLEPEDQPAFEDETEERASGGATEDEEKEGAPESAERGMEEPLGLPENLFEWPERRESTRRGSSEDTSDDRQE